MVEYPDSGAVILHTYLDPRETASNGSVGSAHGKEGDNPASTDEDDTPTLNQQSEDDAAPMLVGVVVAGSSDEAREARRAAARLERVGREFQKEWLAQTDRGLSSGGD